MRKSKKIQIAETILQIDLYSVEGPLEDFIAKLTDFPRGKYSNIQLSFDGEAYEGPDKIVISGERLENDTEYNHRILMEQRKKERDKKSKMNQLQKTLEKIKALETEAEKLKKQTAKKKTKSEEKTRLEKIEQ